MGPGAVIYIPSVIKIGSGIQKFGGRGYTDTQTGWRSDKRTLRMWAKKVVKDDETK
jgi:hypothetical protein